MSGACVPCGARRNSTIQRVAGDGPVPLGNFPDCTVGYSGPPMFVTVVGRLTPNERIYPGWQIGEASVYAASHADAALETISAYRLCADALVGITPP